MTDTITTLTNRPAWVDLGTSDAAAARDFYSRLFGWEVDVSDDPQYGGYGTARAGQRGVAGIGPKQSEQQPSAWSLYIGTDDVDTLASRVEGAGGTIVVPPTDVGDQGRFAVFGDPSGAAVSAWQQATTAPASTFTDDAPNGFGWAELNARGVERAIPFYEELFGWTAKTSDAGPDQPPYTEFQIDGKSVAGAWEMSPQVPANVPSYWQIYFNVGDVDAAFQRTLSLGGQELLPPQDFPGGRFAIVSDPQGASFGLLKTTPR